MKKTSALNKKSVTTSFLKTLQNASHGQKTSLAFILHTIPSKAFVEENELFQVLVIGGSVYKSALLKTTKGTIQIVTQTEGVQPVFTTANIFFQFIASLVDPTISRIGLNFAYAMEPVFEHGKLDGILTGFGSKGNDFVGLEHQKVGTSIEQFVQKKMNRTVSVSCANDTICLLLSGLTQHPWNHLAAGIVGTGLNFALFLDDHTLVNLESAHFDAFTQIEEGKQIDKKSGNPGRALTEKEVSGAYLYQLFNEGIQLGRISHEPIYSTEQLGEIAINGKNDVKIYANEILDRSAGLVASQIAGITLFLKRDTTFVMEGSLFWKGYRYQERVEQTIASLTPYKVNFIEIPNSGILGAAKLVA